MTDTVTRLTNALSGRYDIQRELGFGGMATVYLARDVRHERDVAVKVLHPDLGAALGSERFLTEIRTTARLQHPHILPLLDSGEADGLLYYVMPFVTGESLRARLDREKQLPILAAVAIVREVADALSAAHELGIVHRDIKPENILLRGNHAVVADFGIALAVQQAGGQRMTQTGLSLGTPQYMSPEQAMGERNIGPQSDIYSLGAVAYELIAGDPPFSGHSVQAIVAKVMTEDPTPLSTVRGKVPPHVEDAVLTALSKLPADRFSTAHEFATALGDESRPITVRTGARKQPARAAIQSRLRDPVVAGLGAGVVAFAALSGVLAMRASSSGDETAVTRVALAFPEAQQIVPQWHGFNIAVSSDGSKLAYIGAGPTSNTKQLWLRPLDALEATPVPGTLGATSVKFAPDGQSVLVALTDNLPVGATTIVMSLDGGRRIEYPGAADGDIGASGRVYEPAADSQAVLIIRHAPGGTRDTIRVPDLPRHGSAMGAYPATLAITVVPDESAVLLSVTRDTTGLFANAEIVGISLSSGKATVIGKGVFARYLPSGDLLYMSASGDLFAAPFDAKKFRITGKATAVGRAALSSNAERLYPQVSVSNNGTLVYISGELHRQRLAWLDQQGRVDERLASEGNFWGIALSPDGSRVALSIREDERAKDANARGTGDIFVEDTRTGARTRLTSEYLNIRPSWTAAGQHVLFARVGDAEGQSLVERRADAATPERLVLSRSSFRNTVGDGRWHPDHRSLVMRTYASRATASRDLLFVAVNGSDTTTTAVAATRSDEHSPALSADGSLIAYVSNESGTAEVYAQSLSGGAGRLRVSSGGASGPRWSRDGRLYYWDSRSRLMVASIASRPALAILGTREIGGDIVPSTASPGSNLNYDVAPDGRILVTESLPGTYSVILVRNWLSEISR